ncbi:MAG: hypothetical protein IJX95_09185 [Lachnospiraceae bacterium]|nr:hypothetical protein [Lachnospiraceae bacterium]
MKLLYGTTNNGKLQAMKNALKDFDIELIGLRDMEGELPQIEEDGATPLENAELKARAYFDAFHMPVFSCDSGLYFEELTEEEQPGLHVRRVGGKELTDEEMIEHYAALAKKHGGKITGRYRNAIYFILDESRHFSSMDMSIATEPFVLVTKPHEKRVKGFPLDSLSVDIATGKYYYDLEVKDVSTSVDDGVRAFFAGALRENQESNMEEILEQIKLLSMTVTEEEYNTNLEQSYDWLVKLHDGGVDKDNVYRPLFESLNSLEDGISYNFIADT